MSNRPLVSPPMPGPMIAPGCYVARDYRGDVIYVGKAKNVYRRLATHAQGGGWQGAAETIEIHFVEKYGDEDELEIELIKKLKPKWNVQHGPNKVRRKP